MSTKLIPGTLSTYLTAPLSDSEIADMLETEGELSGTIRIAKEQYADTAGLESCISRKLIGSDNLEDISYRIVTSNDQYLYLEVFGCLELQKSA